MRLISKIIGNQEKPVSNSGGIIEPITTNPNLLDNPWFTVNQRGQSSYSAAGYTVDRWALVTSNSSLIVSSAGVSLSRSEAYSSQIKQYIEDDSVKGRTVTVSILLQSGEIISASGVFPSSSTIISLKLSDITKVVLADNESKCSFTIRSESGNTLLARAVKLEIGSVSTLHLDTMPDYALELAKCQTSTADPNDTYANQGQLMTSALQGELGAKNLFPYPYDDTSKEENGLIFTDNADGTISISGEANAQTVFAFFYATRVWRPRAGNYIFSTGLNNVYIESYLVAYNNGTYVKTLATVNTNEVSVTIDYDGYDRVASWCAILSGTVLSSPVTLKPMLRDARIQDPTWVPYAMTNRELTERTPLIEYTGSWSSNKQFFTDVMTNAVNYIMDRGESFFLIGGLAINKFYYSGVGYGIAIPTGQYAQIITSNYEYMYMISNNNGTITVRQFSGTIL